MIEMIDYCECSEDSKKLHLPQQLVLIVDVGDFLSFHEAQAIFYPALVFGGGGHRLDQGQIHRGRGWLF